MVEKKAVFMISCAPVGPEPRRSVSLTRSRPRMQSQAAGEKVGGKDTSVLMMR